MADTTQAERLDSGGVAMTAAHNGGGEMPISYGSVCSGIEAASVAWHHLGWVPRWFAEIEPFPSAVLAHHWPEVSNLGDFTAIRDKVAAGTVEAPDVLVGGTPCQAFSIAGLRQSLDDKRGQLTIEFVRLANAIDSARSFRGQRPVTVVWENVPGVLNTPDNAFGCFLAGLVGEDDPLEPPGGRWSNAGYVRGPARAAAWRILDAQYFGVAQRRRRVFVVASAGGIRPESVLFELDGVRRDSPPSREAGQGFARVAGTLTSNRGGLDHPAGNANELCIPVAPCLQAGGKAAGSATQQDAESGALVVQSFDGYNQNVGDVAQAIRANKSDGDHVGMVFYAATQHHGKVEACVAGPITRQQHQGITGDMPIVGHIQAVAATGDVFHTLRAEGADASEDGTGRGCGAVAVGSDSLYIKGINQGEQDASAQEADAREVLHLLREEVGEEAFAEWRSRVLDPLQRPEVLRSPLHGPGLRQAPYEEESAVDDGAPPRPEAVPSIQLRDLWENGPDRRTPQGLRLEEQLRRQSRQALPVVPPQGSPWAQVRRLTPTEAERLQGFPDGHTRIPWRGKPADQCPDGPRYKALGNSMAVPVMRWIGARIARQLEAQA